MARAFLGSTPPLSLFSSFSNPPLASTHFRFRRFPFSHKAITTTPDKISDYPMEKESFNEPHSSLEVVGGARDRFVPVLKNLDRPYKPFPLIGWNCHLETIFAAFFRSCPDVTFRRECLRMVDGGTVAMDWVAGDDLRLPRDSPVLVLLPGLTGGSQDSYVRHLLIRAKSYGWRVVVFNSRGCGNSPVTTPKFYSASFLGDMREVVKHLTTRYPEANLYAVGWSLGGNILVNYLGQGWQKFLLSRGAGNPHFKRGQEKISSDPYRVEDAHSCPLTGAVSLCNPFNLVLADEELRKGFNNVYDRSLSRALRRIFKKHADLFNDMNGEFNIPLAANARTVREYDDGITRVSFGFKSCDEYYSKSSSADVIKDVKIPLLCIQAANDPIAPERGIPREVIKENPNCLLIVTPKGGHLGWVAGPEAPLGAPWTDPFVMDFLLHLESKASKAGDSSVDLRVEVSAE